MRYYCGPITLEGDTDAVLHTQFIKAPNYLFVKDAPSGILPTDQLHGKTLIKALRQKTHWLFDMDGTLTNAIHDFDAMRTELKLPAGKPILESIAELSANEAKRVNKALDEMEYDIACKATAQPHAEELLTLLQKHHCHLGIVTRNAHGIAKATLKVCGLDGFFTSHSIVGRECTNPKPLPDGVKLLLSRFSANAANAVMVGDHLFDLEAGKRAGTSTIHLDPTGNFAWPEFTDCGITSLQSLAALWQE